MANRAMMERDMASAPQRTQGLYLPLPLSTERSAMELMIGSLMPVSYTHLSLLVVLVAIGVEYLIGVAPNGTLG